MHDYYYSNISYICFHLKSVASAKGLNPVSKQALQKGIHKLTINLCPTAATCHFTGEKWDLKKCVLHVSVPKYIYIN